MRIGIGSALIVPCALAALLLSTRANAHGDATWVASLDTTIGSDHLTYSDGKGTHLYAGDTYGSHGIRRALTYFNIASTSGCTDNIGGNGFNDCVIPSGSQITSASVTFYLEKLPGGQGTETFSLYRLYQGWSEGSSNSDPDLGGGGLRPASGADATWQYRVYSLGYTWSTLGGYFSGARASNNMGTGLGAKTFSSANLASDVQLWVNSASSNHGWILRGPEATTYKSARVFGSRESATASHRPTLHIQYLRPQGASCSATHDCKSGLSCTDGVCCNVASCTALNECHYAGTCQPGSGTCSNPTKTNGTACSSDSNVCTSDVCESGTCSHLTNQGGVLCRAKNGDCDLADYCSTGSSTCPDNKKSSGTACTNDGNPCTIDKCNGTDKTCPYDPAPNTQQCRASAGVCDVAEFCDGVSTTCPVDGFLGSSTQCRAASCLNGTTAILPAFCSGGSASCPSQTTQNCSPTTCQGSTCLGGCAVDGDCASGNYCDAPTCKPLKSSGTTCGANHECSSGYCVDGVCCNTACGGTNPNDCQACNTGTVGQCQTLPSTHVCNASQGVCDVAEYCNGSSTSCPSNSFKSSSTECRAASCTNGVETLAADCPGNGVDCPQQQTQSCDPFVCGATACRTSCTADTHCIVGDYCNGSSCVPKVANGLSCSANHQCTSGHCTDGVCCNTACNGQCQACDVTPGVCKPVTGAPRGSRAACAADGSACDGYCNGTLTAQCFYPGGTTECTGPSCTNGVATLQAFCNGSGSCPAEQTQTCSPFSCGPTQCFANCSLDVQCADGYFCSGGLCKPKSTDGKACGAGNQCQSGFCVDGVCCDAACSGQCQACDSTGSVGTCTAVTGAPHGSRPACITDGSLCGGTCDGKLTSTCTYAGPGTVCRQASCTNDNATIEAFCTGTGHCPAEVRQDCAPFQCNTAGTACAGNCTLDTDCAPSQFCAGGVCTPKRQVGDACSSSGSCISGVCVDGYCCNEACTGQCEACDVAGSEGTCSAVSGAPHGTRAACTGDGTACDGACDGSDRTGCAYPTTGTSAARLPARAAWRPSRRTAPATATCPAMQQQVCPASCNSSGLCAGGCTTNSECGAGKYCSAGVCVAELPDGQPCSSDAQCTNAHCVDGYCCNVACSGQCHGLRCARQPGLLRTGGGTAPRRAPDLRRFGPLRSAVRRNGHAEVRVPGQRDLLRRRLVQQRRRHGAGGVQLGRHLSAADDPGLLAVCVQRSGLRHVVRHERRLPERLRV